jgi:hypothetical protein
MRPRFLLGWPCFILFTFTASACYQTVAVSGKDFFDLGSGLTSPRPLRTAEGKSVRFDAQTKVRVHTVDGGMTDWVGAGDIMVSDQGLRFGEGTKGREIARANVRDLSPEALKSLEDLAPPLARVEQVSDRSQGEWHTLTTAQPGQLLPWVSRFIAGHGAAGGETGRWWFDEAKPSLWAGRPPRAVSLSVDELGQPLAGTDDVVLASGVRWPQVAGFELNYLDPVRSATMVPATLALFPLLLVAPPDNIDNGMASDKGTQFGDSSNLLWRESEGLAKPLFTPRARRRAIVRLLASAAGAVSHREDVFTTATLGLRFLDFYEVSALVGNLWPRESKSMGAGGLLVGFTFGMHIDGDGDPRFALYAGLEAMGIRGHHDLAIISLLVGPRFGLGNLGFVEVIPLGLSVFQEAGTSASGRIVAILRMGGAF